MDTTGRTVIASTVFLDLVGFSERPVAEQLDTKARLNNAILAAIAHVAEAERLVLDTGDGAALCFLGDPEDALFTASSVGKVFASGDLQLRIGVNLGPIKVVTDINGLPNVVGDGINVAQRVMDFAAPGEILVSRSYYEVVARLRDGNERLFHYAGSKRDKHVREHQVYTFSMHDHLPRLSVSGEGGERPSPPPAVRQLAAADIEAAQSRLADQVGPIAEVLVKRAAATAGSVQGLYETIATAIPDKADRETFLASAGLDAPRTDTTARTDRLTPDFDPAMLDALERDLAQHIGPLAKILVKKNARQAADLPDLCNRLAKNIQEEDERRAFLATALART